MILKYYTSQGALKGEISLPDAYGPWKFEIVPNDSNDKIDRYLPQVIEIDVAKDVPASILGLIANTPNHEGVDVKDTLAKANIVWHWKE